MIPGIHADAALVAKRGEQGFEMITIGFDFGPLVAALRGTLAEGRAGFELNSSGCRRSA